MRSAEQNILGLDVAMDDALAVGEVERLGPRPGYGEVDLSESASSSRSSRSRSDSLPRKGMT